MLAADLRAYADDIAVSSSSEALDFSAIDPAIGYDPNFRSPWPQNASGVDEKPIMVRSNTKSVAVAFNSSRDTVRFVPPHVIAR